MVISPLSGPVAWGVNVTWMAQLAATATVAFTQLSVSLKFPVIAIDVGDSARLPVLARVTVIGLLGVLKTWLGKASAGGLADAEVRPVFALHSAVCQMPRPYVAASNTCEGEEPGVVLRPTAGAPGNPVPNTDQQLESDCAQFATCVVKYTP